MCNIFDSLESFHIHVGFSFDSIFQCAKSTIEIKGVIFLIAASSIQVIDGKIRFNSIAILTLGSIELISYESKGPYLLRNENIFDNKRSD